MSENILYTIAEATKIRVENAKKAGAQQALRRQKRIQNRISEK